MTNSSYDLIVVGSGPGGASTALDAAKRGLRVLILERGDNKPVRGTLWQTLRNLGWPGRGLMFTSSGAPVTRGITVGGSSVFYYATAFEPPVEEFKTLGIDLTAYREQTLKELPIATLKDELLGPAAARIMAAAKSIDIPWERMPKFIDQKLCRAGCWRCQYGCPYNAKWNARMLVNEAVQLGTVLLPDTRVLRVNRQGNTVTGVTVRGGGKTRKFEAPMVVLSAGGIGTPHILEQSGIKGSGRDFFTDPLIAVFGILPKGEMEGGGAEIPMATGHRFADEGFVMTDMTVPRSMYQGMALAAGRFHRLGQHQRALTIMVKVRDELSGNLFARGVIRKPLSDADKAKLKTGHQYASNILEAAGARGIFKGPTVAAHPGGTAKIGDIVDTDLQTSVKGLFVCDCSVIPKPWGLPPTWTLLCLGKRLGEHLAT